MKKKLGLAIMKCYFGLLLYMGIVKKPSIEHYWSTSIIFGSQDFRETMSEDHLRDIHSSLHFTDENENFNENDSLTKIRLLIEHIIKVSQGSYSSEEKLSLYELNSKEEASSKCLCL